MANQIDTDPYKGLVDPQTSMKYKDFKSGFKRGSIWGLKPWMTVLLVVAVAGIFKGFVIDNFQGYLSVSTSQTFAADDIRSLPAMTDRIDTYANTQDPMKWWVFGSIRERARQGINKLLPQRYALLVKAAETNPGSITKKSLLSASVIASLPVELQSTTGQTREPLLGNILYNEPLSSDGIDSANQVYQYLIQTTSGNLFPVYIGGTSVTDLINATVQIDGSSSVKVGDKIIIPDSSVVRILETASSLIGSSSNPKLTIVLVNGGTTNPKLTSAQAQSFFNEISGFYKDASYGRMNFDIQVTEWQKISTEGLECNTQTGGLAWGERARAALGLGNPGPNSYYGYIIVPGNVSCSLQGFDIPRQGAFWMVQNAGITTMNQPQSVYVHEIGHLVGLLHEGRGSCPSGQQSCSAGYQEYAEDADGDIMGRKTAAGSATDLSNIHKEIKGWLSSGNIQNVSSPGGIYALNSIHQSSGIVDVVSGVYHFEYRPSSGIKVRTTRTPSSGFTDSTLVTTLTAGEMFKDGNMSAKFCGANGDTASIDVRFNGAAHTCSGSAIVPGVTKTPTATTSGGATPLPTVTPPSSCGFLQSILQYVGLSSCATPTPVPGGGGPFTLSCPGQQFIVLLGPSATGAVSSTEFALNVSSQTGFTGPVNFVASVNPGLLGMGTSPVVLSQTISIVPGGAGVKVYANKDNDLPGTYTVTVRATGGGTQQSCTIPVQVMSSDSQPPTGGPAPTVTLTANGQPSDISIQAGAPVTLAWNSNNATYCILRDGSGNEILPPIGPAGSRSVIVSDTTSFSVTCRSASGVLEDSIVNVRVHSGAGSMSCQPLEQTIVAGQNFIVNCNVQNVTGTINFAITDGYVVPDISCIDASPLSSLTGRTAGDNRFDFLATVHGGKCNVNKVMRFTARTADGQIIDAQNVIINLGFTSAPGPANPVQLDPAGAIVNAGQTISVNILGGTPPYRFATEYGSINTSVATAVINGSTLQITGSSTLTAEASTAVAIGDSFESIFGTRWVTLPITVRPGSAGGTPPGSGGPSAPQANCSSGSDGGFNFQICFSPTLLTATVSNLGQNSIVLKMDGSNLGTCGAGESTCSRPVSVSAGSSHSLHANIKNSSGAVIANFDVSLTAGSSSTDSLESSCSWWDVACWVGF